MVSQLGGVGLTFEMLLCNDRAMPARQLVLSRSN
jgi:hypothetical protein